MKRIPRFLHLTVDKDGLISLWDSPWVKGEKSYLKLPLTEEQRILIAQTQKKGGDTP